MHPSLSMVRLQLFLVQHYQKCVYHLNQLRNNLVFLSLSFLALPSFLLSSLSLSSIGLAFTLRGSGYFLGTFVSAGILEFKSFIFSKQFMVCLAVSLTGLANGILTISKTYPIAMFIFLIQGLSFGFIDTFANCLMPEIWGVRVNPWMQTLHSCFGIGAVIGPSLVGTLGWINAFILIAFLSLIPVLGLGILTQHQKNKGYDNVNDNINNIIDNDETGNDNDSKTNDNKAKNNNNIDVPLSIRLLIALFYVIYVGIECGYGGWISTYVLQKGVTDSSSDAAFVSAIFWSALTVGRVLAVFFALIMKGHTMLKIQLILTAVSCILVVVISPISYINSCIAAAVLGYSLSSIFPLAMILSAELGFYQSDRCTTLFVIGACIGEGAIPAIVGVLIGTYGADYLSYSVVFGSILMFIIYFIVVAIAPSYQLSNNNIQDNDTDMKNISISINNENTT